ncbi:MAG: hypothetical protein US89_C0001G0021 [Candidatus Peregrinibacteria bacterium GW2011_GWF2_38_29]|nr:MAG: hypothetical protein US89_C0001G0021 [Candidatus Peregrinibacteria bacterium GW2011_GWF2_38_29]HBB03056.1 hypothetical protein [Candidatus Peregrinibacteria bacterium]
MNNIFKKTVSGLYTGLFLISPLCFILGMIQTNFQKLLPYQEFFHGKQFFDFYTISDILLIAIFTLFLFGFFTGALELQKRPLKFWLGAGIFLIFVAGAIQILFQKTYDPILSSPIEYFRSMFIFPIFYALLVYKTLSDKVLKWLMYAYISTISLFCVFALTQYFFNIFPGVQYDFTQRLVWPYIDFLTLKWQSANWVTFLIAPAFVISFIKLFNLTRDSIRVNKSKFGIKSFVIHLDFRFWILLFPIILIGLVLYFAQSYGSYMGIALAIALFLFRSLKLKHFLIAFLVLAVIGSGVFLFQRNSAKYKIWTGEKYRYATSVQDRKDIYKMNLYMLENNPVLGVGLNQYQSYFALNKDILGHEYNELNIPPHAHNFFLSMWLALGIIGLIGILLIIFAAFFHARFNPLNPAIFAFVAIIIHGIVDSYYWKPEIAYTVWLIIIFSYLYKQKWTKSQY